MRKLLLISISLLIASGGISSSLSAAICDKAEIDPSYQDYCSGKLHETDQYRDCPYNSNNKRVVIDFSTGLSYSIGKYHSLSETEKVVCKDNLVQGDVLISTIKVSRMITSGELLPQAWKPYRKELDYYYSQNQVRNSESHKSKFLLEVIVSILTHVINRK